MRKSELKPFGTAFVYTVAVLRVVDGDTLDVIVDLGFSVSLRERIRIDGINAPEIHAAGGAGVAARDYLATLVAAPASPTSPGVLTAATAKVGRDREKFGRWLARVTTRDGRDVAAEMIAAGHAVAYHGEKR